MYGRYPLGRSTYGAQFLKTRLRSRSTAHATTSALLRRGKHLEADSSAVATTAGDLRVLGLLSATSTATATSEAIIFHIVTLSGEVEVVYLLSGSLHVDVPLVDPPDALDMNLVRRASPIMAVPELVDGRPS